MDDAHEEAIRKLAGNRALAHDVLFAGRHPQAPAEFHPLLLEAWYSARPRVVSEVFRDGAKSTLAEETVILGAGFREFHNGLVIGSSETRAIERLDSIKHEIETNELVLETFGDLRGPTWAGHKAITSSGIMLQALGVGQSLRGIKFRHYRPDFVLVDDFEDDDSVRTPEARRQRLTWLYKTLLPALAKGARIRIIGNRLDDNAVIVQVARDPSWYHQRFPVMYQEKGGAWLDGLPPGEWVASWPAMYDLAWIANSRSEYARLGLLAEWEQEYMCEATIPVEQRLFQAEMFRQVQRTRAWEAVYCMIDPARTSQERKWQASTGLAAWSYEGPRIIVWRAERASLPPSGIIEKVLEWDSLFRPVVFGIEEDGLQEFLHEPLRAAMLKHQHPVPIRGMLAPRDKGKETFISGLQPYFKAHEIEFAGPFPDLIAELESFPKGLKDIANALAFCLLMKPGMPMYEEFDRANIAEELHLAPHRPAWLALNATRGYTTGVLLQLTEGFRILADWVEEGDPATAAKIVLQQAALEAGVQLRVVGVPSEFEKWSSVGLAAAVARFPAKLEMGMPPEDGRAELRNLLQLQARGVPRLQVSWRARWTLNGFAGGYAREYGKGERFADFAREGVYKTLMEGIESLAGRLKAAESNDAEVRYDYTADGRKFISMRVDRERSV